MTSSGLRMVQQTLPWQNHDERLSLQAEHPHTLSKRRSVGPSNQWVNNSRAFLKSDCRLDGIQHNGHDLG